MNLALVFEKDKISSDNTSQLLRWIGYFVVVAHTSEKAMGAASCLKFSVVICHSDSMSDGRRSLAGELRRYAADSTIILITESDGEIAHVRQDLHSAFSLALKRPVSLDTLRRTLEFGTDGHGSQRKYLGPSVERRSKN